MKCTVVGFNVGTSSNKSHTAAYTYKSFKMFELSEKNVYFLKLCGFYLYRKIRKILEQNEYRFEFACIDRKECIEPALAWHGEKGEDQATAYFCYTIYCWYYFVWFARKNAKSYKKRSSICHTDHTHYIRK